MTGSWHRVSAADRDQLAGDLTCRRWRREPEHRTPDVVSGGESAQRGVLQHEVDLLRGEDLVFADCPKAGFTNRIGAIGYHETGADDVRPDPGAAMLTRGCATWRAPGCLAGALNALPDSAQ